MKQISLFIAVLSLFTFCTNSENQSVNEIDAAAMSAEADVVKHKDTTVINFNGVSVALVGLQTSQLDSRYFVERESKGDTFNLELSMEEILENAEFFAFDESISTPLSVDFMESQVNVLSIQDEGPHFDLDQWQTYTIPYKGMEPIGGERYKTLPVDYENLKFDLVDYQSLLSHLDTADDSDKRWYTLINNMEESKLKAAKAKPNYPLSVGVGYVIIKVSGTSKKGAFKKWIRFTLPQGC